MASVYRGDRHDDARSTYSTNRDRRDNDGGYTKVTRYIIKEDDDTRSNYSARSRRPEERVEETRISARREVDEGPQLRREEPRYERDIVIRTRNESPPPARERYWERRDDTTDKEIVIRRTTERDEPRQQERELAVSRVEEPRNSPRASGFEISSPRDPYFDRDRDLQHYSRTAEYYAPPQPQTIIIRQDPIIIRERVRDDDYQLVRKSDAEEERSMVSRKEDERSVVRRDQPRDEEYFYEKKVRERVDPRDEYDDRRSRREVSPGDSVSQVGRRRRGSYGSDDSMVYVRRVKEEYDSREASPDRKKNLAAGVIAGVGAAELIRNHRKKEGKDTASGIGRVGRDVGAGALGALAVEGIQRYRSQSRRRRDDSRDRSWSGDRSYRSRSRGRYHSRSRSRSRSRSGSRSKLKTLGALGLGAVAVAAAATIASKKMKENKEDAKENRRSRSRRRNGSVDSLSSLENDSTANDARNPKHRNSRIAAAGAVGAAGAALIERARSKSRARDGEREHSKTRIQQGLPIVAAGLGTAALAGLYEKNKAKREAEQIQHEQKQKARSRSRQRSRTRDDSYYNDSNAARSGTNLNDPAMWTYGNGALAGNNFGPEYYGGPARQEPYYNPANAGAMVPAVQGGGSRSGSTTRDMTGRRSRSRSSSGGERQNRRRSRDGLTTAAAVAGAGAGAAEYERRKAEKKERKARKREQDRGHSRDGRDPYEDTAGYGPQQAQYAPTPPPANDPYASQFYPQTSQYPPPPGSMPQQYPGQSATPLPQFNRTPVPPQNAYAHASQPYDTSHSYNASQTYQPPMDPYGTQSYPPPPPQQQGFDPYASGANPYAPPRNRGADENVSAGNPFSPQVSSDQHQPVPDGISTSRSIKTPPSINIEPSSQPSTAPSSSIPNLTVPSTYVPPAERPDTPPEERRHVQFASSPEISRIPTQESIQTSDTDAISPDSRRQRRRNHETNRGYEASEDTDTMPEHDPRSRAHDSAASSGRRRERDEIDRERGDSGTSTPRGNRSRDQDRDRDNNSRRGSKSSRDQRRSSQSQDHDGNDSDSTIELPDRFDNKGRRRDLGDEKDPLASKLDDILAGKGSKGKVFGNFMEGLLGPEGKDKDGSGDKRRRRRRDDDN